MASAQDQSDSASPWLRPSQWPWLVLCGLLFLIAQLPLNWLLKLGRWLTPLAKILARPRVRVIRKNLALSFPELSEPQFQDLCQRALVNTCIGLFETVAATWRQRPFGAKRIRVEGLDLLDRTLAAGSGALLVAAHFTPMMLCARALSEASGQAVPMLARRYNQPTLNHFVFKAFRRFCSIVIDKHDLSGLIRTLKAGHAVFYAPDQFFRQHTEATQFFGQATTTLAVTPRVLRAAKVPALLLSVWRDGDTYTLKLEECPEVIAKGSAAESAVAYMQWLEQVVRAHPSQYLWAHRRFKPSADDSVDPYRENESADAFE